MATIRIIRTDRNVDAGLFTGGAWLIGQAADCALQLPHPSVAPVHAGIKWLDGEFWLSALSASLTLLNGATVQHAVLTDGAVIRLGAYLLRVTLGPEQLQLTVEFALGLAPGLPVEAAAAASAPSAETQQALDSFWVSYIEAAGVTTAARPIERFLGSDSNDVRRRWPWRLAAGSGLVVLALAALVGLAFPRAYAPAALSAAHTRPALTVSPAIALKPGNACTSCHTLTGSMQSKCASCHTTPAFQPALGAKHAALALTCRTCHGEHQGAAFKPAALPNALCVSCHQATSERRAAADQLHGGAVNYPVRRGVWSWDGVSQADWQRRGLPGQTADFNLREQFHMLHTQGTLLGRAQCNDCHLGLAELRNPPVEKSDPAWKLNVREACAQCHSLQPALAAALAQAAQTAPLKPGQTLCVACHAQHGPEKDLRASTRR